MNPKKDSSFEEPLMNQNIQKKQFNPYDNSSQPYPGIREVDKHPDYQLQEPLDNFDVFDMEDPIKSIFYSINQHILNIFL